MRILTVVVTASLFWAGAGSAAEDGAIRVEMATAEGDVVIELYLDKAPVTAGNFLQLIDDGDLDGGSFYRVVNAGNDRGSPKIDVIQGGLGNDADGFDTIAHESTADTGILHTDGVISMARGAVGTASTEFFICIGDQPGLDHGEARNADGQGFAAFGKVVSGMDVVRRINGLPADAESYSEYTKGQILNEPVSIDRVRRVE
jgi:peptidyl-prolyl cis-trans isomerase A (cyclophilin A)